jgi:chromosome partitioning protein
MRMGGGSTGTGTIIAVAQSKGGAGKTTLAAHLAVAWSAAGSPVALIDTDPQRSLTRWHQQREERLGKGNTGFDCVAVPGVRVAAEATRRARTHNIVLIDSPAGGHGDAEAGLRAVIGAAHLVLVPVQPSPMDVWATLATLKVAERAKVPTLLVLNRAPSRAALTNQMLERLQEYEVGFASSVIGNRIALAAAIVDGWGIVETARGSDAAKEIAALADEVMDLLPRAAAA